MSELLSRAPLDLGGEPRSIHLIGIGGAGMSAIAEVLAALGHRVSGSDQSDGPVLERLRSHGIEATAGHEASKVVGVDYVGVSTAITADNPEVVRAGELGIPVGHRFDLLAAIGATRSTLSISGTHGKTTTSALAAHALGGAGWDPSFIIGGDVVGLGSGARWTESEWFVLEADESDSTFLAPPRAGAVVTNIEADHLDHHGSFESLVAAFERFVDETAGPVLVCLDDVHASELAARSERVFTYGSDPAADYWISEVLVGRGATTWTIRRRDGGRQTVEIGFPGMHLVRNATAAVALAIELGADPAAAAAGIARYRGVGRRFERRGVAAGVTFIDDYAHLPTEVRAVLSAAQGQGWSRIVCVFQPHRFSRTGSIWSEYAEAFDGADVLVLTEIYAAGEAAVAGVSGDLIVGAVTAARPEQDLRWLATRSELVEGVSELLRPGDLCLTLGAGDLTTLPDQLIARLGGADAAGANA